MKLQSTAALRAQFAKAAPEASKPPIKDRLHAQQYRRTEALMKRLRDEPCGDVVILPLPIHLLKYAQCVHWSTISALKNQYFSLCDLILLAGLIPRPPDPLPDMWRVSLSFYGAGHEPMDKDNATAMAGKWPHDWLKGKYMVDDSPQYFEIVEFNNLVDKSTPRLEFRTVEGTAALGGEGEKSE